MTLWVQHGYGKSDKIDQLTRQGAINGVILSPADEDQTNLVATATSARDRGLAVLVDPQVYVGSITGGTARCHRSHGLDLGRIHWGLNPNEIGAHVQAVVSAHDALGVQQVCSPTCIQRGFTDAWTTLAIQYARATLDVSDDVYVSVVVEETALGDWGPIEDWLDVVTTLDARGFYLVIVRTSSDYPQPWNQTRLTNLLRLIHRLSVPNEYEVILGYSDAEGLLAQAAGAHAFGSGWYYTLRAFTELKWQPSSGGRAAKARVTSTPLMSSFRAEDEGYRIALSGIANAVFPDSALADRLIRAPTDWGLPESWLQHLAVLGDSANVLESSGLLREQREHLRRTLSNALSMFQDLRDENVLLPPHYQTRVATYLSALAEFEAEENPA